MTSRGKTEKLRQTLAAENYKIKYCPSCGKIRQVRYNQIYKGYVCFEHELRWKFGNTWIKDRELRATYERFKNLGR